MEPIRPELATRALAVTGTKPVANGARTDARKTDQAAITQIPGRKESNAAAKFFRRQTITPLAIAKTPHKIIPSLFIHGSAAASALNITSEKRAPSRM